MLEPAPPGLGPVCPVSGETLGLAGSGQEPSAVSSPKGPSIQVQEWSRFQNILLTAADLFWALSAAGAKSDSQAKPSLKANKIVYRGSNTGS